MANKKMKTKSVPKYPNGTSSVHVPESKDLGFSKTTLKPENERKFQKFRSTLPTNLKQDTDDYDLRGYWEGLGSPEFFDYKTQNKESDGFYHAFTLNPNTGKVLKSPSHPTFKMAMEEEIVMGNRPYSSAKDNSTYVAMKDDVKKYNTGTQSVYVPPKGSDMETVGTGLTMASTGASIGSAGGPVGTAIGAGVGLVAGLGLGHFKKQEQDKLHNAAKANQQYLDSYVNNIALDAGNYAMMMEDGIMQMPDSKVAEVEEGELIFRKMPDGKFKMIADYEGGRTHEEGGHKIVAKKGDVIFPSSMRDRVMKSVNSKTGKVKNNPLFSELRSQLPVDAPAKSEYPNGTEGIDGDNPEVPYYRPRPILTGIPTQFPTLEESRLKYTPASFGRLPDQGVIHGLPKEALEDSEFMPIPRIEPFMEFTVDDGREKAIQNSLPYKRMGVEEPASLDPIFGDPSGRMNVEEPDPLGPIFGDDPTMQKGATTNSTTSPKAKFNPNKVQDLVSYANIANNLIRGLTPAEQAPQASVRSPQFEAPLEVYNAQLDDIRQQLAIEKANNTQYAGSANQVLGRNAALFDKSRRMREDVFAKQADAVTNASNLTKQNQFTADQFNQQQMMATADLNAKNRAATRDYIDKSAKELAARGDLATQKRYMMAKDEQAQRMDMLALGATATDDYMINPEYAMQARAYADGTGAYPTAQVYIRKK